MSNEVTIPIQVLAAPTAGFVWEAVENQVFFRNSSEDAFSYLWDFGDGSSSTEPNPIHSYNRSGSYEVTLNTSNGSCAVASAQTVTVIVNATEELTPDLPVVVYPNPTRGAVNIRGAAGKTASLYNLQGQLLERWRIDSDLQGLSLSQLPGGIYLLVLEDERRREVFRILKE
jgi:PKD repeat protein